MRDRLIDTLASSGVPVDTVSYTEPFEITFQSWATPEQISLGNNLLANFDYSEETQKNWEENKRIQKVKDSLESPEVIPSAARAGILALMLSLQEARAKINQIIEMASINTPKLVTGSSFGDAIDDVKMLLDLGVVK